MIEAMDESLYFIFQLFGGLVNKHSCVDNQTDEMSEKDDARWIMDVN